MKCIVSFFNVDELFKQLATKHKPTLPMRRTDIIPDENTIAHLPDCTICTSLTHCISRLFRRYTLCVSKVAK